MVDLGAIGQGVIHAITWIARAIWNFILKIKNTLVRVAKYIWSIRKTIINWIKFVLKMVYYKAKLMAYYIRPAVSYAVKVVINNPHLIMLLPVLVDDL